MIGLEVYYIRSDKRIPYEENRKIINVFIIIGKYIMLLPICLDLLKAQTDICCIMTQPF